MAQLPFDRDAKDVLRQIIHYIGIEQMRPDTARNVARKIYHECERYAHNPLIGERRDDLLAGMRVFTVRPYVVFTTRCPMGFESPESSMEPVIIPRCLSEIPVNPGVLG
jgi:plasmid stabilization system protein ParE